MNKLSRNMLAFVSAKKYDQPQKYYKKIREINSASDEAMAQLGRIHLKYKEILAVDFNNADDFLVQMIKQYILNYKYFYTHFLDSLILQMDPFQNRLKGNQKYKKKTNQKRLPVNQDDELSIDGEEGNINNIQYLPMENQRPDDSDHEQKQKIELKPPYQHKLISDDDDDGDKNKMRRSAQNKVGAKKVKLSKKEIKAEKAEKIKINKKGKQRNQLAKFNVGDNNPVKRQKQLKNINKKMQELNLSPKQLKQFNKPISEEDISNKKMTEQIRKSIKQKQQNGRQLKKSYQQRLNDIKMSQQKQQQQKKKEYQKAYNQLISRNQNSQMVFEILKLRHQLELSKIRQIYRQKAHQLQIQQKDRKIQSYKLPQQIQVLYQNSLDKIQQQCYEQYDKFKKIQISKEMRQFYNLSNYDSEEKYFLLLTKLTQKLIKQHKDKKTLIKAQEKYKKIQKLSMLRAYKIILSDPQINFKNYKNVWEEYVKPFYHKILNNKKIYLSPFKMKNIKAQIAMRTAFIREAIFDLTEDMLLLKPRNLSQLSTRPSIIYEEPTIQKQIFQMIENVKSSWVMAKIFHLFFIYRGFNQLSYKDIAFSPESILQRMKNVQVHLVDSPLDSTVGLTFSHDTQKNFPIFINTFGYKPTVEQSQTLLLDNKQIIKTYEVFVNNGQQTKKIGKEYLQQHEIRSKVELLKSFILFILLHELTHSLPRRLGLLQLQQYSITEPQKRNQSNHPGCDNGILFENFLFGSPIQKIHELDYQVIKQMFLIKQKPNQQVVKVIDDYFSQLLLNRKQRAKQDSKEIGGEQKAQLQQIQKQINNLQNELREDEKKIQRNDSEISSFIEDHIQRKKNQEKQIQISTDQMKLFFKVIQSFGGQNRKQPQTKSRVRQFKTKRTTIRSSNNYIMLSTSLKDKYCGNALIYQSLMGDSRKRNKEE